MKKCASFLFTFAFLTVAPGLLAQGTTFTYQGQLVEAGAPANGFYDFKFALSNAPSGGSQVGSTLTQTDLGVSNGVFTTTLNFGGVFTGNATWLAISVRSNGVGSYMVLTPPQEITPTPYAIFANTASNVSGTLALAQMPSGVVTNNEASVTLSNVTISGNLTLPAPSAASGTIYAGGNTLIQSDGNNNFYAGPNAGGATSSGGANTGIGNASLQNNTNGTNNTGVGYATLFDNTNGSYNTASGERALSSNTSGNDNTADGRHALVNNTIGTDNTAVGYAALASLTTGSYNIVLGSQAGNNYTGNATSNILIGNPGVSGDNNTIRIGSTQTTTFIAGMINGDGGGLSNLVVGALAAPPGMVLIPAGTFTMGATTNDSDITDANPTAVTVSAFYMDANLVTYSQWESVYFWATENGYSFGFPGSGNAANQPVQMIWWYDAVKWCNARSQQAGLTPVYSVTVNLLGTPVQVVYQTGLVDAVNANFSANGYRLPTEAEWEKAARGGLSGQRFPWGNVISQNLANYFTCTSTCGFTYDLGPDGQNPAFTATGTNPAGYFAPNGYGLYDMAGNVFEWCWDWYGKPYGQPTTTNPTGPATGTVRVVRGCAWDSDALTSYASSARCAYRSSINPGQANYSIGFRCVKGL